MRDPDNGELGKVQPVTGRWRGFDKIVCLLCVIYQQKEPERKLFSRANEVQQQVAERNALAVPAHPDSVHLRQVGRSTEQVEDSN